VQDGDRAWAWWTRGTAARAEQQPGEATPAAAADHDQARTAGRVDQAFGGGRWPGRSGRLRHHVDADPDGTGTERHRGEPAGTTLRVLQPGARAAQVPQVPGGAGEEQRALGCGLLGTAIEMCADAAADRMVNSIW
jgi:hypothetical protein